VAVATNRHTVLLKELPGVRLTSRPELVDPRKVLKEIMETVREAYSRRDDKWRPQRVQHPHRRGGGVLIDWPQWVGEGHPNAKELMKRDVGAVVKFFDRSYGLSADVDALVGYVTGGARFPAVRRV